MRTPNTFNHTTVQNDHPFDILRDSYITLGAKRIYLKVTPFCACSGNKEREGFFQFFYVSCIEEILCLYRLLGYH